MGITSLQVCMDPSNWIQDDSINEETEFDSSSSQSAGGDIFSCSRPLMERKLRPQHDQPLKCPRCESTHTKFCYYNNYSLSQPRYFCKSCRRYWTKGGTLRNIPVGGGCRKNKKISSKKSSNDTISTPHHHHQTPNNNYHHNASSSSNYPEIAFSHFGNFMGINNNLMLENHHNAPIDFMESKYEALVGTTTITSRNQNFIGNVDASSLINGYGEMDNSGIGSSFNGGSFCSTFGLPMDGNINNYEAQNITLMDVKPNPKILSLEWHDHQGCSSAGNIVKESFGYLNGGLGSWTGLMNSGYGSSTTNPLV